MIKNLFITISIFSFFSICTASEKILVNYSNIAKAKYTDSLLSAKKMQKSIYIFLQKPSEENMRNVKDDWLNARKNYQKTEVFRFGPINDFYNYARIQYWPDRIF